MIDAQHYVLKGQVKFSGNYEGPLVPTTNKIQIRYYGFAIRYYGLVIRYNGFAIRYYGLVIRYYGLVIRYYGLVIRYYGLVIRYYGLVIRYNGLAISYYRFPRGSPEGAMCWLLSLECSGLIGESYRLASTILRSQRFDTTKK